MFPLRYWTPFLVPVLVAASAARDRLWGLTAILWLIAAVTSCDVLRWLGPRTRRRPRTRSDIVPIVALRLWVPAQIGLLAWALHVQATRALSWVELVGVAWSVGLTSAIVGISAAHELMHGRSRFDGFLAEVLMSTVGYTHFCVSHRRVHHRWAATTRDPASARLGETFYAFFVRSYWGGLRLAYAGPHRHASSSAAGRPAGLSLLLRSERTRHVCLNVAVWMAVLGFFGIRGLAFFAFQSAIAVAYLEATNYVQHYGLRRLTGRNGRLPPCQPCHAWDAPAGPADWLYFNLGDHGAHHAARPIEREPSVSSGSYVLPANYIAMVTLALFPPVWFLVMDGRVFEWHASVGLLRAAPPSTTTADTLAV